MNEPGVTRESEIILRRLGDAFPLVSPEASGVAWIADRVGSYMQTPLLLGDLLYVPRWRGTLICLRPESGEIV